MSPKEIAFQKISQLVKRFEDQSGSYLKSDYNEAKTRQDFINPCFQQLSGKSELSSIVKPKSINSLIAWTVWREIGWSVCSEI